MKVTVHNRENFISVNHRSEGDSVEVGRSKYDFLDGSDARILMYRLQRVYHLVSVSVDVNIQRIIVSI